MSETVTEQETAEEVVDELVEEATESAADEEQPEEAEKKEEFVPVSAHVAERKKRQEAEERRRAAEERASWLEQQMMKSQQPSEPTVDNSNDLLTVGQQQQALQQWKQSILEEAYMEQNPEIVERMKTELPEILKDPRHQWLADSIKQAPNRLQRAAQVLEMFKPKREAVPPPSRRDAPKSPQSVAKTNKMSIADRLMTMSDEELEDWRVKQKRNIR